MQTPKLSYLGIVITFVGLCLFPQVAVGRNSVPKFRITAPVSGSHVVAGSAFSATLDYKRLKGSLKRVNYFVNGSAVGTAARKPFSFMFYPGGAGTYEILAVAVNKKGKVLAQAATSVIVDGNGGGGGGGGQNPGNPNPPGSATGHPRIWIREADLSRLQSWATSQNDIYEIADHVADQMKQDVQNGIVPGTCVDQNNDGNPDNSWDSGESVFSSGHYTSENYAQFFAFMSLIEPDPAKKAQYVQLAHDLVMTVINQAKLGTYREKEDCIDQGLTTTSCACRTKRRYRDFLGANSSYVNHYLLGDKGFIFDGVPTAIDWVYQSFSPAERASIRQAFLIWIKSFVEAEFNYAPRPISMTNNPALLHLDDPELAALRFGANNHYLSYARGVGLMALTLDAADDTGPLDAYGHGVRDYIQNVIQSWLYITDYERRYDSMGGLSPEGAMYSDLGFKFEMQLRLAIATAGQAVPSFWGEQVSFYNHPFWDNVVPAFLHNLPPVSTIVYNWQGPVYEPAWYGDGQQSWQVDVTGAFASIAAYDMLAENSGRVDQIRWLLKNVPPGGAANHHNRISSALSNTGIRDIILSYMVYDPAAPAPADPRPSLGLVFYDQGLGRLLARTGWDANARFFSYKLGFNRIDHNHGDANMFEFWRKGQWLTKKWVGYGQRDSLSDFNNTLAVKNYCGGAGGTFNSGGYNYVDWQNGSQFLLGSGSQAAFASHSAANWNNSPADPHVLQRSHDPARSYAAITGDSTILYNHYNANNAAETCEDVSHVSRSVVWLKPDHIVVYDRAVTGHTGFKRFWLSLQSQPNISSDGTSTLAVASSVDNSQQLAIRTLLPAANAVSVSYDSSHPVTYGDETATGESVGWRLKVEPNGGPADTRILNVLQGLDSGGAVDSGTLLQSSSGTAFDGAAVKGIAVLFKRNLSETFTGTVFSVPSGTTGYLITGLQPGGSYSVSIQGTTVTIQNGAGYTADEGGVVAAGSI